MVGLGQSSLLMGSLDSRMLVMEGSSSGMIWIEEAISLKLIWLRSG